MFLTSEGPQLPGEQVRAVELELAALGYVASARLAARLARCSLDELVGFRAWAVRVLRAHIGADQLHEPLFRSFPDGVPDDTLALWWTRVLVHFLQADDQPCLSCRRTGTTHVLSPCFHVVCDHCFDGANYSACPVCGHHVDRSSPFFLPSPERGAPVEKVVFKLLDLGEDAAVEAKAVFTSLCERTQALSPVDRDALDLVLGEHRAGVLAWLPDVIPVRENVAAVFGTLFRACIPDQVLPYARRFMKTATDVLRFIAVLSGTDGSLLGQTVYKQKLRWIDPPSVRGKLARLFGLQPVRGQQLETVPVRISRFKMARLPRPLRRALLGVLEGMHPDRLAEDMLRHRSFWVWVGEFLHPHEYAARFPNAARAFQIVRGKAPDGTPAPEFRTWYSRLEERAQTGDTDAMLAILAERPGELARRFDHTLRIADGDAARDRVVATFASGVAAFATPVLLTLRSHLRSRTAPAAIRVYWPKGRVARGVSSPDERATLPRRSIDAALAAIDLELLRRFAERPRFAGCVIDRGLRDVVAPFNERTASRAAISLPRGSRVPVPAGKLVRLFLHWCQPKGSPWASDLDLSVAFYDDAWRYVGVCSYYELRAHGTGGVLMASSSGDLTNAPWPDGASEFVDLHRVPAIASGVRYAVMVVNNYAGQPFSQLERGFAGLMLRDDPGGHHFDPRTVELKFALDGENGVFMPLVLDLRENLLHWLDVQSKGRFEMNNVETSKKAIAKICPELMTYFTSGVRTSMFDLGLLHAAARCDRVFVRGDAVAEFVRRPGEGALSFHARLVRGEADEPRSRSPRADGPPVLALLFRGDMDLPDGSSAYTLIRERVTPSLAASDLLV